VETQHLATACRIERKLETALLRAAGPGGPPLLAAAMHDAVFPAGARVRPRLCLAVAAACGDDTPALTDAAAAAIELLHCASLVHDDLPCFDDAETRRGRPAVHRAYGEPLAVLAGDALIVLAFQVLAQVAPLAPLRAASLIGAVGAAVGAPHGIVAGQAWESEAAIDLASYHRAKTGALFAAAAMAGAVSTGADGAAWETFGATLGHAYQVADDIRDAAAAADELGKPTGQDSAHARPNAVARLGLDGAVRQLRALTETAMGAIPPVAGADGLRALVAAEMKRLMPRRIVQQAA
jgi:geranylgeranyl diphosphate synthase type II